MKRRPLPIAAAAFVAFIVILLARFPAKWAASLMPSNMHCDQIAGTLWNGTCLGFALRGAAAGDIKWDLHLLKLFTGKLSAQLAWSRGTASAQGDVDIGLSGAMSARNIAANFPLDPNILPWVSQEFSGRVNATLASVHIKGATITEIEGVVDGHDIASKGVNFGDYRVTFPHAEGNAEPVGTLADLGNGPLRVSGQLKLTRAPGYEVHGLVAAKPGAPAPLTRNIEYLGRPDAQGMRPFGTEGTF